MIARTPAARRQVTACSRLEPQPQFSPATMMSPGCTAPAKVGIQVFQRVPRHLRRVADRVGVLAGEDHVGVDVVAVDPGATGERRLVAGCWKLVARELALEQR